MVNVVGGRQGWDVTEVPVAGAHLSNGQQQLTVEARSGGDGFAPVVMGLQVAVDAPLLALDGALDPTTVDVGSTATYELTVDNAEGAVSATGAALRLALPAWLALVTFSIDGVPGDASGAMVTSDDLAAGVDIGAFAVGTTKTIVIVVRATGPGTHEFAPGVMFDFVQCTGAPVTSASTDGTAGGGAARLIAALPNSPPVLEPVGDKSSTEGRLLTFRLTGSDSDLNPLSYSATGLPAGASLDRTSGEFSWVPGFAQAGEYLVVFRVSDGSLSDEEEVSISVLNPTGPVFSDGFSSASQSRKRWAVISGSWTWSSPAGALAGTSLSAMNMARISDLDPVSLPLGAGVITAKVTLASRAGGGEPNGVIVFGYRGASNHRWIKVRPGAIQIGQTGTIDGIAPGVKRQAAVAQAVGAPVTFTVKVRPSGLVQVYRGNATTAVVSHRFLAAGGVPSVARGGVGLGSQRARTVFDNVKVWEDSALGR
jgi:hypothetical protein